MSEAPGTDSMKQEEEEDEAERMQKQMKPRIKPFLPVLAVGVLAFVGCGGSDSSTSGPSTPSQPEVVVVNGEITSDTTWTANNEYLIQGALFVRTGATLTIQAGTTIFGDQATTGTLVIDRGARLVAQGDANNPIVFTSSAAAGSRARGQWGGLILNGFAPLNIPGGEKQGEGGTGALRRQRPERLERHPALRPRGVRGDRVQPRQRAERHRLPGHWAPGTTCDHIQVHFNLDDGFEWFGGTTACKYLVASAAGDDAFDWTDGYQGRGQFWIAQQRGDDADNGFEADNLEGAVDAQPRSAPRIYNVTLIGDPDENEGTQSSRGMLLRRGTAGTFRNFIVQGFKRVGVEVNTGDGGATIAQANSGALSMSNSIVTGNGQGSFTYAPWRDDPTNSGANPEIAAPYDLSNPNFMPSASGPARNGSVPVAIPPAGGYFDAVDFIGAMGGTDWTQGWTDFSQN